MSSVAGGASAAPALNTATYEDERAEQPGAPDITSVRVANDDTGVLRFEVAVPTHPRLTQDMRVRIWLWDADPATGLTESGADYFILVDGFLIGTDEALLYRCAGTSCGPDLRSDVVRFSYASGARFAIDAESLGVRADRWSTTELWFAVEVGAGYGYDPETRRFDFTNVKGDVAPSRKDERWRYALRIGPDRLLASTPELGRSRSTLVVRTQVRRDDTKHVLTSGIVGCSARMGSHRLETLSHRFADRYATCLFALPSKSRDRVVRGSISVRRDELVVTRAFASRIH